MKDCVFCKIANHESSASIKFENEEIIAFDSIEPAAETHILFVPKKHISTFLDINLKDSELFIKMISAVQEFITRNNLQEGYKLVFNGGKYQAIQHLHWHLLAGNLENEAEKRT